MATKKDTPPSTSPRSEPPQTPTKKKRPNAGSFEVRWGKDVARCGFTQIPNVLIENMSRLGLSPTQFAIIAYLAKCWWRAGDDPYPAKSTIAKAIGVKPRAVQKNIAALEQRNLVVRSARTAGVTSWSLPNAYQLNGLAAKLRPIASTKLAEKREAEKKKKRGAHAAAED